MRSNDTRTYLEQFGKGPEIGELKRQILTEGFQQNISDLTIETQVDAAILLSSERVTKALQEVFQLKLQIQGDLKEVMNLISLEKLKKDNWHYVADNEHPNIASVMLELMEGNTREYNRIHQEALLCLQYLNTCNKGYFDTSREKWRQESYPQKYSNYIELLREMCELKIINQMIEEKWRNAPDLE